MYGPILFNFINNHDLIKNNWYSPSIIKYIEEYVRALDHFNTIVQTNIFMKGIFILKNTYNKGELNNYFNQTPIFNYIFIYNNIHLKYNFDDYHYLTKDNIFESDIHTKCTLLLLYGLDLANKNLTYVFINNISIVEIPEELSFPFYNFWIRTKYIPIINDIDLGLNPVEGDIDFMGLIGENYEALANNLLIKYDHLILNDPIGRIYSSDVRIYEKDNLNNTIYNIGDTITCLQWNIYTIYENKFLNSDLLTLNDEIKIIQDDIEIFNEFPDIESDIEIDMGNDVDLSTVNSKNQKYHEKEKILSNIIRNMSIIIPVASDLNINITDIIQSISSDDIDLFGVNLFIARFHKLFLEPDDYKKSIFISEKYAESLMKYTKYYDRIINDELRKNNFISKYTSRLLREIIDAIDESDTINKPYILFRGIRGKKNPLNLEYKGFSSKTVSIETANNFTGNHCCFLIIEYPPGTKQLSIKNVSKYEDEDELITYPDEKFTIVDTYKIQNSKEKEYMNIIHLKYIDNNFKSRIFNFSNIDQLIDSQIYDILPIISKAPFFIISSTTYDELFTIDRETDISTFLPRNQVYDLLFRFLYKNDIKYLILPKIRIDENKVFISFKPGYKPHNFAYLTQPKLEKEFLGNLDKIDERHYDKYIFENGVRVK